MNYLNTFFGRLSLLIIVCAALTGLAAGQKNHRAVADTKVETAAPEASVAPVVFDGQNITCADLNASTDPRFSHIIDDYELKLNFGDPNGSFPFSNGGGRVLIGPAYPTRAVTLASGSATVSEWSSQVVITAVNVKVGNTSYVYPYKPFATHDTNLATGDNRGISHVTFCYADAVAPTAAKSSISGRVVNADGTGISGARMTIIDGATGESFATLTSPFGYYVIDGIEVGRLYVLNVNHKRYTFAQPLRTFTLNEALSDIDFVANR